jgi:ubiquinone/menaquinone biosynthesis C-methylase UbiE
VRLLKKNRLASDSPEKITAIDLGCGTGRHTYMMLDMGIDQVIAADYSMNALLKLDKISSRRFINCDTASLPFKSSIADIAVAWGSLHYDSRDKLGTMIDEIRRVLKKGGHIYATLRSEKDTYLKTGEMISHNVWRTTLPDIKDSIASFYGEEDIKEFFSGFSSLIIGSMQRSLMGRPDLIIAHWIIDATR